MTIPKTGRRRRWGWLRWPIALGVMAWLILPNLEGLKGVVSAGVIWPWLCGAAGLRLVALGLASVRWRLLLVGQEILLPGSRIFRLLCTGYVCNFLLPGTWGGDIARASLVAADSPDRRMRGAATVPLDRGLGLLAFVLVGAIAGLIQWSQVPHGLLRLAVVTLIVLATAGVGALCALLLLPLPRRFRDVPNPLSADERSLLLSDQDDQTVSTQSPSVESPASESAVETSTRRQRLGRELLLGLYSLRESRLSVVMAFLLAIVGHMCLCLSLYCCLPAYPAADVPVTAMDHFWIVPAAEVPAAFLPVPGGVGAREGTLALLYGSLTTDKALSQQYAQIGVIVAATFSMVCLLLAIVIGLGLVLIGTRPIPNSSDPSPARVGKATR